MAGPIRISILANALQARREMRQTSEDGRRMGRTLESVGKVATQVKSRVTELASGLVKGAGALAQVASTAAAAAPMMLRAGGTLLEVAKSAGNAAPALLAVAAAAAFVKLTLIQIGPAIGKALDPVTKGFKKAGAEAGKLASKGVQPLAASFVKLGMPIISADMNTIAKATNRVVKGFLSWAQSGPGINALSRTTLATATAFKKVAPHVLNLTTALGEMIGRIANVSLAAGSKGLTGILDKLTEKVKGVTAKSVQDGLNTLKDAFTSIRDTVATVGDAVSKAIAFYRKYETQIKLLSDAFAVFAIVFGGPVTAIVAAVGLVIRHFDTLKGAFEALKSTLSSPGSLGIIDQLRGAVQTVVPAVVGAFNTIKAAVMPTLIEIGAKIRDELIPAFADFVVAMAPVVKFFVERLAPVAAAVFGTIVKAISGALDIIIGILKVFTGILTGDWSKTWEGIKQILSGALAVVKALINGAFALIKAGFANTRAVVAGVWNGMWALVKDAASRANAIIAAKLAQLAIAVRNKFNEAKTAARQKIGELVASVRDGIGRAVTAITSIDLFGAGRALISRLLDGIKSMIPSVGGVMGSIAGRIRGFLPGSPIKEGPLKPWNSGAPGQKLIDLLIKGIKNGRHPLADAVSRSVTTIDRAVTNGPIKTPGSTGSGVGCCCGGGVTVNFNGPVGDPVEVGRQIDKTLRRYYQQQGRAA